MKMEKLSEDDESGITNDESYTEPEISESDNLNIPDDYLDKEELSSETINTKECIYYYNAGLGNNGEDLSCGEKSKDELRKTKWITWADFPHPIVLEFNFRQLASLTSSGKMDKVMDDMITHFMSGTGEDYSNYDLTNAVSEHIVTQAYMSDFANAFYELLQEFNGDVNNDEFIEALKDAET